jgi:hypothetical protein
MIFTDTAIITQIILLFNNVARISGLEKSCISREAKSLRSKRSSLLEETVAGSIATRNLILE